MRFALSAAASSVYPVMLPPGRARLAIVRIATASPAKNMTIGIVAVARAAAAVAWAPTVTIASGFWDSNSATRPVSVFIFPSAKRMMNVAFFPSS